MYVQALLGTVVASLTQWETYREKQVGWTHKDLRIEFEKWSELMNEIDKARGKGGRSKTRFLLSKPESCEEYSLPTPGWNWGGGPLHLGEGLNASALGIPSVCAQAIWWVIFNKTLILKRGRGSLKLFPTGRTKRVFFRLNVIKHR